MDRNVEVIEVDSSALKDEFIKFPYKLYKEAENWVPPLISERREFFSKKKNPFYRVAKTQLFLAKRDGQTVGRIATCINYAHNEFHEDKVGFFGFFDTVDDYEVASKLLKVAMITLKKEGMEIMRGPMNFSTNHEIGFLIEGFEHPPTISNPWNYPYQPKLAEQFGLKKVMDLHGYQLTKETPIPERHLRVVERVKQRNKIKIRAVDFSKFEQELKIIREIYNGAWEKNWGFVPLAEEEFYYLARSFKEIADPDLILIAEVEGEPAGFSMAIPDVNQALIKLNGRLLPFGIIKLLWYTKVNKVIDGIRNVTMGVMHKFHKRGIDNVIFVETYRRADAKGYNWAEQSWILETNELMISAAKAFGSRLIKKYRIVEMPI